MAPMTAIEPRNGGGVDAVAITTGEYHQPMIVGDVYSSIIILDGELTLLVNRIVRLSLFAYILVLSWKERVSRITNILRASINVISRADHLCY